MLVCGLNLCSAPHSTDAAGAVTIDVNLQEEAHAALWRLPVYVRLLAPVTMASTTFPSLATAALPSTGAALAAGADAVSGSVTLAPPAGAAILIDTLSYGTPDQQRFRAAPIPVDNHQQDAVPGIAAHGLLLVFGTTPLSTSICPPAKVTVANSLKWSAGQAVEFWVLGDDVGQQWAPYGDWAKISDGQVSADGQTITTADGQGFPVLLTFGIRLKS